MNPTPSPIEVVVHTAAAADWQVWAAFAPLIAAVIAAIIAGGALWQRWKADNRAEWWRRAQWALESSFSDNPDQSELGLGIIESLAVTAPGPEEARIIAIASADPLRVAEEALFTDADALRGLRAAAASLRPVGGGGAEAPEQGTSTRVDDGTDQGDNGTITRGKE